jgi:hypothetical protein
MILAADKKIPEYDEWIVEVTEFAVNCFCW